jgi:hypothetical protein
MNPDDGDYNVPLSGAMRETVLRLQEQAYRKGYLYEFLTSFRTISDRLRGSPLAFGEEIYDSIISISRCGSQSSIHLRSSMRSMKSIDLF